MHFLLEVGFGIGKNVSWNPEMRAGYELSTAYSLNHDFYHLYLAQGKEVNLEDPVTGSYWKGFTYRQAIEAIDKDERQGKVQVFKDPRLTWDRRLISLWFKVRKDIKLLILHRKTEDIHRSRCSLSLGGGEPKIERTQDPNIYKTDFCDFMTEVMEKEIPFELLFFPNFLRNPEDVFKKLTKVGLPFNQYNGYKIWDQLVDKEKAGL